MLLEPGCEQPLRFLWRGQWDLWEGGGVGSVSSLPWHTGVAYKAGHAGPSSGGLEIVSYRGWAVTIPSVKGPSELTSVGLALPSASAWKPPVP